MRKKAWPGIAAALALILIIVLGAAGNYLVNLAVVRKEKIDLDAVPISSIKPENQAEINSNTAKIRSLRDQWLSLAKKQPAEITSRDGLKLKGDIFRTEEDGHRWLLTVHGYLGKRSDMRTIAAVYGMKGYSILMPDLRAHGESEGNYIGMGWLDRIDLQDWISYLLELDPRAEIILHGISMGGAAVMMAAGDGLPPQVKGIVEDCGYTSVWDIFSDKLDEFFHLPAFPLLYICSALSGLRAGYFFGEASALEQIKKCDVPILFIHGSEDHFVHTEMVYEVYEACPAPKDLLVVKGAGHGSSFSTDPEGYFEKIFSFLEETCF